MFPYIDLASNTSQCSSLSVVLKIIHKLCLIIKQTNLCNFLFQFKLLNLNLLLVQIKMFPNKRFSPVKCNHQSVEFRATVYMKASTLIGLSVFIMDYQGKSINHTTERSKIRSQAWRVTTIDILYFTLFCRRTALKINHFILFNFSRIEIERNTS